MLAFLKILGTLIVGGVTVLGFLYMRPELDISSSRITNLDGTPGFFIDYRKEGNNLRTHNLLKVTNNGHTSAENITLNARLHIDTGENTPTVGEVEMPTANGKVDLSPGQSIYEQVDGITELTQEDQLRTLMRKIDTHEAHFLIEGEISYTGTGFFSFFSFKRNFSEDVMKNRAITLYNQD